MSVHRLNTLALDVTSLPFTPRPATSSSFVRQLAATARLAPDAAERAAETVLCGLTQRLELDGVEVDGVGLEGAEEPLLPLSLRGLLRRCSAHEGRAPTWDGPGGLVSQLEAALGVGRPRAEALLRATVHVLRTRIPDDAQAEVQRRLPDDLQELWHFVH
jgi:uncharacterized protein (DUF2267 family)